MTPEQIATIRALEQAATVAPWEAYDEHSEIEGSTPAWMIARTDGDQWLTDIADVFGENEVADAALIVALRNHAKALLAEVDRHAAAIRLADAADQLDHAETTYGETGPFAELPAIRAAGRALDNATSEHAQALADYRTAKSALDGAE